MPNLQEMFAKQNDRITNLLTKRNPQTSDISKAFSRASSGRSTYGNELNAIKAGRIGEESALQNLMMNAHKRESDVATQQFKQEKSVWEKIKFAREQGVTDAKAAADAIERYVVNDADRAVVAEALHKLPDKVNALNADQMVSRVVQETLGKQTKTQQPSTGMQKVEDKTSETGWSWKSPSGEVLPGAPAPSGGLEVTVGPEGTRITTGQPTASQAGKHTLDLEDHRVSMLNFMKASSRMLADLEKSGDEAIGIAGGVERFMDSLTSQGKVLAKRYGDGGKFDKWVQSVEWDSTIAAESAAIKSQIVSLAYGLALVKNGARPTDEDVRYMLKTLAAQSGSVNQIAAASQSMMREAMDNYSTRHLEATQEEYDWPAALDKHGITLPGQTEVKTDADYEALPSGTKFTAPDGTIRIKP